VAKQFSGSIFGHNFPTPEASSLPKVSKPSE